jgi:uncharacterized protein
VIRADPPIRTEAQLCPPWASEALAFSVDGAAHLFVVNGSRIYAVEEDIAAQAATALEAGTVEPLLAKLGLSVPPMISEEPPLSFPTRAISLAIAQRCNLGCAYCYASGGDFGGPPTTMPPAVAIEAVRRLIDGARPGEHVSVAFLGGEPLTNRAGVFDTTTYAAEHAAARDVDISFSITTNGTLVSAEDGRFFERHGFAVTVSLDGIGATHDRLRPFKGGKGSFARIVTRITPLLAMQQRMQVSARVTVTPHNLAIVETLDALIAMGFHSVGFSPMLAAPTGEGEMRRADLMSLLEQMIACGRNFERHLQAGRRYPFANMVTALRELHRGSHRPYPCGAGGPYLGVAADGALAACHRFVGDPRGALGTVQGGVDPSLQRRWLAQRHVHHQEPCRSCWARYLCGGGCHHEVIHRGRPACDYIRGWLHYCLQAYVRLSEARPDFFEPASEAGPGLPTG